MIYKTIYIFFASLGFSMIIGTDFRHYLHCAALAAISYCLSVMLLQSYDSILLTSVICACAFAVISQLLARKRKAPATIFLIPSILPLVPGSRFFYAISSALAQNSERASMYFFQTLEYTAGISTGIVLGSSLIKIIYSIRAK